MQKNCAELRQNCARIALTADFEKTTEASRPSARESRVKTMPKRSELARTPASTCAVISAHIHSQPPKKESLTP